MAVLFSGHVLRPLEQRFVAENNQNNDGGNETALTRLLVLQPVGEQEEEKNPGQWKKDNLQYFGNCKEHGEVVVRRRPRLRFNYIYTQMTIAILLDWQQVLLSRDS